MLSILIPTYNYNVLPLVKSLSEEIASLSFPVEIVVIDDASPAPKNKQEDFIQFLHVKFLALNSNLGRSKVRNLLAKHASFDNLIFLDSDTLPVNNDFIYKYLQYFNIHKVIFGGIEYTQNNNPKFSLRHKYGTKREAIPHNKRQTSKTLHFTTANFGIKKSLFSSILFNETLLGYGYEDIIFSNSIIKRGFSIKQINNPVYHLQLDNNKVYLEKIKQSIKNLYIYNLKKKEPPLSIKILKYYHFIELLRIQQPISYGFYKFEKLLLKNLLSKNPNLWLFDMYRIGYFCTLKNKND
ncbi:glycosyltransferase family 2 protein [Mangrovimonas sp. TPBH4]|uniref:glycosyltransferase family 2 protein n=1 Tax=Mangrovimonas sp. TPBH4 TaxID=1645914 RepID=UPI0006B5D966|nr:glycosyltransferase [Mangrovimonas sp. TPBH4]